MRTLNALFAIAVAFSLAGCGGERKGGENAGSAQQAAAQKQAAGGKQGGESPVEVVDGTVVVRLTGNDKMEYNLSRFEAKPGQKVRIEFENVGDMAKSAMGHNVTVLKSGVDVKAFVKAATQAKQNDFIPPQRTGDIIAHTKLLGPDQKDAITFTAPEKTGKYDYVCTFPAHYFAGMKGKMVVAK